jgi:hypothetical protein
MEGSLRNTRGQYPDQGWRQLEKQFSRKLGGPFFLRPLKSLDHIGRHRMLGLDFLENALLVL